MNGTYHHPVTIGNLTVPGNLFLAPLAGFTDVSFRALAVEMGADFTYTEMISVEGLRRDNRKTLDLLERTESEKFFGIQIFLSDPETLKEAGPVLRSANPDLIDINCGCPVPKVVKTGAGSALLKDPPAIERIVLRLKEETDTPVTVKIRSGWDSSSLNYLETADAAVSGGAAMITLHARTRTQGYSGEAAYSHLKRLKEHLTQPVFGSGDLFTAEDALRMFRKTGVDGVMFARGAIGNPFIFQETHSLLSGEVMKIVTPERRAETFLRHLDLVIARKGEPAACREMRKHSGSYIKGCPGASAVRRELVRAETRSEYCEILDNWLHGEQK